MLEQFEKFLKLDEQRQEAAEALKPAIEKALKIYLMARYRVINPKIKEWVAEGGSVYISYYLLGCEEFDKLPISIIADPSLIAAHVSEEKRAEEEEKRAKEEEKRAEEEEKKYKAVIVSTWLETSEVRDAYKLCEAASIQYELDRGRVGQPSVNSPVLEQLGAGGYLAIAAAAFCEHVCGTRPTGREMAISHRNGWRIRFDVVGTELEFYVEGEEEEIEEVAE